MRLDCQRHTLQSRPTRPFRSSGVKSMPTACGPRRSGETQIDDIWSKATHQRECQSGYDRAEPNHRHRHKKQNQKMKDGHNPRTEIWMERLSQSYALFQFAVLLRKSTGYSQQHNARVRVSWYFCGCLEPFAPRKHPKMGF